MEMENSDVLYSARATTANDNVQEKPIAEQSIVQDAKPSERTVGHATSQDMPMENAMEDAPPLTHALEALLGGLESPVAIEETSTLPVAPTLEDVKHEESLSSAPQNESTKSGSPYPVIPGLFLGNLVEQPAPIAVKSDPTIENPTPIVENAPTALEDSNMEDGDPASIENKNESRLENSTSTTELVSSVAEDAPMQDSAPAPIENKIETVPQNPTPTIAEDTPMMELQPVQGGVVVEGDAAAEEEHPEWEIDSSPIESSSDDSSSDSSSDESEEGENAYKLLSPEEQARILMEGDGGSDDEGGGKSKGAGGQLRTKNEVPEVIIPKPDVTITADMPIVEVGAVEHIVESTLVIRAKTSGEFRCLESGSVLCLEDRSVIGAVAEILGPVQKPLYSVMFTNAEEIAKAGLSLGTKVFYSERHSTFVFTQALKAFKGSDASNLHDEEVGDEEIEFSDDEAEAEHKRRVKQKRMERRGGKMQQNGRGGHPLQQQHGPYDAANSMNYDDAEEDGPYRPLARPAGFENSVGHREAPQEGAYNGSHDRPNRDQFRGRGRGGDRGRGDRGRGRGDRGRGRGGYQDRRGSSHSLPPRPQSYTQSPSPFPPPQFQPPNPGRDFSQASPTPPPVPNFYMPPQAGYSQQQPQMPWPPFPIPPQFQQAFQNVQNPWQSPSAPVPQGSPAPGGAFINPAFLPGQWNNQGGSNNGGK